MLLALDAIVHAAGPEGRRTIPLSSFFVGYRKTALRSGEILTTIEIPKPLPALMRFYKVAKRRLDDISTVAAAMALDWEKSGNVRRARFAFGGVAATPLLAASYSPVLVPVGILLALLGYILGTGFGLVMATLLSMLAPV